VFGITQKKKRKLFLSFKFYTFKKDGIKLRTRRSILNVNIRVRKSLLFWRLTHLNDKLKIIQLGGVLGRRVRRVPPAV
jgi:hypothetical protein